MTNEDKGHDMDDKCEETTPYVTAQDEDTIGLRCHVCGATSVWLERPTVSDLVVLKAKFTHVVKITCQERDDLFATVGIRTARVSSSITNYVAGQVIDDRLPPHTATTWCTPEGVDFLRDVHDANGCRHWSL